MKVNVFKYIYSLQIQNGLSEQKQSLKNNFMYLDINNKW